MVDFIFKKKDKTVALEIKNNNDISTKDLDEFRNKLKPTI